MNDPAAAGPAVLAPGILAGRSCLVTGAGSGIGRAIALRFAALGAAVFGLGRRPEPLRETARAVAVAGGVFRFATCDLREAEAAAALVGRIGDAHGIDVLVNNAGGQFAAPAEAISRRGWAAVIELNLDAVFAVTSAAFPYLKRRGGSVVNISLSHVERGSPGIAHSVAARAGVLGLTRTLALEWARHGIRLNCIGPGIVDTPATHAYGRRLDAPGRVPLGRPTAAEEVAELAAFLASPAGAMMTGQLVQIDGGAHLGPAPSLIGDAAP